METIFALASARGKAGVAVIRISGPEAHRAVSALCPLPVERRATLRDLVWQGEVLDQALVIAFDAGRSFTGEAMAELQIHGSVASINALSSVLLQLGLRQAEAGEFTRRALANGRLDLAQVEGLADMIEAETEAQRRQAMRVLSGALGVKAAEIKSHLVRASSLIAALIDFSGEELPDGLMRDISLQIDAALGILSIELKGFSAAERIRDGFEVAIIGAPNVGKSTLLNALAGREAAITSSVAGTTRDVIEVRMDVDGLAVTLLDTAGLRDTEDLVEQIGVARARARAQAADLRLFLTTGEEEVDFELLPGDLVVRSKSDRGEIPDGMLAVSALTGAGVPELNAALSAELSARAANAGSATRLRHRVGMERAVDSLVSAQMSLKLGEAQVDLVAEDLRSAIRALDSLVGKVDVEDLLEQIFASFCIGK
jgi:tRNA modification GTPase